MKIDVDSVRRALARRPHRPVDAGGAERFAAVAAILRPRGDEAEVLLIRRALQANDPWSGHMAFPGGRMDPTDPDLLATAIRETAEEVGLQLDAGAHLVGRLDDLPAIARGRPVGLVIAPFVFAVEGDMPLQPNLQEVEELVWAPLSPFYRGERNVAHPYELEGRKISLPGYDVEGRTVWGLTHRMLESLFETLMEDMSRSGARP